MASLSFFVRRNLDTIVFGSVGFSALLMLVGHWMIMASGAVFNPVTGEHYSAVTRWVSDFACKYPEGFLIKGAMIFFCVALAGFFWLVNDSFAHGRRAGQMRIWWTALAAIMISGLLLVIFYDMSAAQYVYREPSWLGRLFWQKPKWIELPRGQVEWARRGRHLLGFELFVGGFFVSALSLAIAKRRHALREPFAITASLIILAAGCSMWLFLTGTAVPGVPQRLLLVLIFIWLIRNYSALRNSHSARKDLL